MRDYLAINGGRRLSGEVRVSGAKNSALPLLMATLLSSGRCRIENVPDLDDIEITLKLLRAFGAEITHQGSVVTVYAPTISRNDAPHGLTKAMRASFWVLGPILARTGEARVALPGGDAIGTRPVDLHLQGLVRLGAEVRFQNGVVVATAPAGLRGGTIELAFPSVGATHQLLMTAALIPDETIISGAAREPEVVELCEFLSGMGAEIEGAGTARLKVRGQAQLAGADISVIGDRIEAATYLVSAVMTHGEVVVTGISARELAGVLNVLSEMGAEIEEGEGRIRISCIEHRAVSFRTEPFPGVATDAQPLLMAAMTNAKGESQIEETIFENRFGHAREYRKFGADISLSGRVATIKGCSNLVGATVEAGDIRAAAGLVLMGLASQGESRVFEIHHLDRGYERMVDKLRGLGADVMRVPAFDGEEIVLGC